MKVLWVNPSFLDYRVALYHKMYEFLEGNFYLLFSQQRNPQRVNDKIENAIGENAIGTTDEKNYIIGRKSDFANKYISIPYQKGLYKKIKEVNPDIIIAEGFFQWTPWAIRYAKKNKILIYIAYERTEHTERNCPKWRIAYRKFISKYVTGYLVNGYETAKYLENSALSKGKIIVEGCMSADSENLSRLVASKTNEEKQIIRQRIIGKRAGIIYLFVGQIIERKGVKQLLDAWNLHVEKHKEDSLLLVGGGDQLSSNKKKYGGLDGAFFLGTVDYDAISDYYAISDVFILPTLEDNWSLVIPEAMACSLPVATSIYNGCYPELVTKDNGYVFDSFKRESIIEALSYFHKKNIDLKTMGKRSFEIEQNYTPEVVARRILKLLNIIKV